MNFDSRWEPMLPEAYELNYHFEETHWWFLARREILLSAIQSLIETRRLPPPPLQILDYGCGTGSLTRSLAAFGDVTGVDLYPEAVAFCRKRGLENVRQIDSPQDLPDSTYDLVGCFDVLEHVEDDLALLRELGRILKPGGVWVLTVPALSCLWSGEDVVSQHKRRYTRRELRRKAMDAGLRIQRITYFNTLLFPAIFGIRFFDRWFRPRRSRCSDVYETREPFNAILRTCFASEKHLLKHFSLPIGVSLLLIAEK